MYRVFIAAFSLRGEASQPRIRAPPASDLDGDHRVGSIGILLAEASRLECYGLGVLDVTVSFLACRNFMAASRTPSPWHPFGLATVLIIQAMSRMGLLLRN